MYSLKIAILGVGILLHSISLFMVNGASVASNKTESSNSSSGNSTDFDDRLNLNFNRAGAFGLGNGGGFSGANSQSYGVNAGIRGPGGYTQNLFNDAHANSQGFSSGPGAPLSFANTGTRNHGGFYGGNANAGVLGGRGQSYAQSINQNFEVPLGDGTVFFSNLKERNSTESSAAAANPNATEQSTTTAASKDSLVFN